MKKVLIAILLLLPALACAEKTPAPNPAEYTVTIHVQSSRLIQTYNQAPTLQHLEVIIDGKKYELECPGSFVLSVGDYKARILQDKIAPNHEYTRQYELLFANGSTRKFAVIGESE